MTQNYTETKRGQELLEGSNAVCFPLGRIKFVDRDGRSHAPTQGQMITYFGQRGWRFGDVFSACGLVLFDTSRPPWPSALTLMRAKT